MHGEKALSTPFTKRVIAQLPKVYAVSSITLGDVRYLLAATEAEGQCLLFSPPNWDASVVWNGPGGAMNLVPVPGHGAILAIQEFFPVFRSERAGIVWAEPGSDPETPWRVRRVLDLPFVHRIATLETGDGTYLLAATLCGCKSFQNDWSSPGGVYASRLPASPDGEWKLERVLDGVHKNHGLHVTTLDGRKAVLISGEEGLFALYGPKFTGDDWSSELLIDHEISDICSYDLDGCGRPEIVAIEPFHGDTLSIYRQIDSQWSLVFQRDIDFGHALWAGELRGVPSIVVGNRGGNRELMVLEVKATETMSFETRIIDADVGPAQIAVVCGESGQMLLEHNHGGGEVAVYRCVEANR